MSVRTNIRQRRHDRIKSIERRLGTPNLLPYTETEDPHRNVPLLDRSMADDPRLNDPEFVWKQQRQQKDAPSRSGLKGKFIVAAVVFALLWGMFQLDYSWARTGQHYAVRALTESIAFDRLAKLYERTFGGAPSFIPTFRESRRSGNQTAVYHAPVLGSTEVSFAESGTHVQVNTRAGAPVSALDTGRVIYVGHRTGSGLTIVIQHANNTQSVYGRVENPVFAENDWVQGGEQIANVARRKGETGVLYFAIKRADRFVDPADVITFD